MLGSGQAEVLNNSSNTKMQEALFLAKTKRDNIEVTCYDKSVFVACMIGTGYNNNATRK